MKYLKRYNEGFLDYFKKNTPDDKITLDMINRLEKVKDINPYHIYPLNGDGKKSVPTWASKFQGTNQGEYFSKIYLVKFDDVDIIITNDRQDLVYTQTGEPAGHKMCKNPWKFYLGSDISDLAEKILSRESYRKKLFHLVDKIYTEDIQRKRINRITSEINPVADLLESKK
jgi:hypothetical protein